MDSFIRIDTGKIFLGDINIIKRVTIGIYPDPNCYQGVIFSSSRRYRRSTGYWNIDFDPYKKEETLIQVGEDAYMVADNLYSMFQLHNIMRMVNHKNAIKKEMNKETLRKSSNILLDHVAMCPSELELFVDKKTIHAYPNPENKSKISLKQLKKERSFSKNLSF